MLKESYSSRIKAQLGNIEVRKKCCRHTLADMEKLDLTGDCPDELQGVLERCRCDGCRVVMIRLLFVARGSVTDPSKAYHLDFSFRSPRMCDVTEELLRASGFDFRRTARRDLAVLYIKSSAKIEDFLALTGANTAAFDLMNEKIVRDFKNSTNRQTNCDSANLEKQVQAAKKYKDAVSYLMETGRADALPEELRATAKLRYENEAVSLRELGALHDPPVSKSGLRHRLDRILEIAEKARNAPEN